MTPALPLPSFRVIYRTPRGTSVEQFHFRHEARRLYHATVAGTPDAFHVTLRERVAGDWLLCDQFHDPRIPA